MPVLSWIFSIDTYENFLITEVAGITDLIIELGIVEDSISITEDAEILITELFIEVEDSVTTNEYSEVQTGIGGIIVYDDISIVEYATVFDIVIELFVFDSANAFDTVIMPLDDGIEIGDDVGVQGGALTDYITVVEDASISIPELFIAEYEDVSVVEQIFMHDIIIELGVSESISVEEYATVFDIIVELYAEENLAVVEYINLLVPLSAISVFDDILIIEYANVFDIIVELFAYDDISLLENIEYIVVSLDLYPRLWDAYPRQRIFETEKITRFEVIL